MNCSFNWASEAGQLCGFVPVSLSASPRIPFPSLALVDAHVFGQRSARREAFPADVAQVRFLSGVRPHVDLQRAALVELLVAYDAAVRRLARVDHHVRFQRSPLSESFPADAAEKWLLARVDPHVSRHVFLVAEALTAHAAAVRFLPRVDPHVSHQVPVLSERLAADGADERFLPRVGPHVHLQLFLSVELFPANLTVVRSDVRLQVKPQALLRIEMFPTDATNICIRLVFLHMLQKRGSVAETPAADFAAVFQVRWVLIFRSFRFVCSSISCFWWLLSTTSFFGFIFLAVTSFTFPPVLITVVRFALSVWIRLIPADVFLTVFLQMHLQALVRVQMFPAGSALIWALLVLKNVFQKRAFVPEELPTDSAAALSCSLNLVCWSYFTFFPFTERHSTHFATLVLSLKCLSFVWLILSLFITLIIIAPRFWMSRWNNLLVTRCLPTLLSSCLCFCGRGSLFCSLCLVKMWGLTLV